MNLANLKPYQGSVFRWESWKRLSPGWDHDHCGGCWARFADNPDDWEEKVYNEGWLTVFAVNPNTTTPDFGPGTRYVPAPTPRDFLRMWLCPECFEAGRQELGFIVDPNHPQWAQAGL